MQERTIPLLGEKTIEKLKNSHIAIFGVGGVGGFVCETLVRTGVKEFSIFDYDTVNVSNKNRQIIALDSTIGMLKVDAMEKRICDINGEAIVHKYAIKITEKTIENIEFKFDYVIDCVDDIKAKIEIIKYAKKNANPVITCCGTGNKLDPLKFKIDDISKTSVCPLAKKLRSELKKVDINNVDCLYSTEEPVTKCDFIPSVMFTPSIAGILIARHVIVNIHDKILKNRIHLVLEGGGMKGVYTAGVTDFFLEKEINFDAVYGVSAGAWCATSYLSKQIGRSYHAMVDYIGDHNYASKRSLTKTGNYFNKDFIYNKLPNELIPYDYDTAFNNPVKLYATVTNVNTGKAEYLICNDYHKDIDIVCASASLPLLAEIQTINGQGYLDGGLADSIPYLEAKRNAMKCIVVLTKSKGYICQKQNPILLSAMKIKYLKYPKLLKAIENRHNVYNKTMKLLEKDKNVFIIRPSVDLQIDRLETDKEKLKQLYELGYNDAKNCYENLLDFMNKDEQNIDEKNKKLNP